ncbi:MAG TPA: DUF2110 family protein [Candidatus Bathyarchaeia archaeon]|nr:DUF2110 family protein [Candidatus Bathyarchaeia archaeon]
MVEVTLITRVYGPYSERVLRYLTMAMKSLSSDLRLKSEILNVSKRGFVQILVNGEDEEIALNYIRGKFGIALQALSEKSIGVNTVGRIVDSGKVGYGLYLDLGLTSREYSDALIPLRTLRDQLVGRENMSIRGLIRAYALYDDLPLSIEISKIDSEKREITAKLTDRQRRTYRRWLKSGLERVIVTGTFHEELKKALARTGHSRDIVRIDSLGLLEHVIVCKSGTEAPGLIAALGPCFPRVPLHALVPSKIATDKKVLNMVGRAGLGPATSAL